MNIAQLNEFIKQFESVSSESIDESRKKAVGRIKTRLFKLREALETQAKANNQLVIAIVGQMKAGKSSLLNALLFEGLEVLPVAPTPMTAGLTIIQYEENPTKQRFEVEYYSKEEWNDIKGKYNLVNESLNQIKLDHSEYNSKERKNKFKETCEAENEDYESLMACYELYELMSAHPESGKKIGQPNDSVKFSDITGVAGSLQQYVGATGVYAPVVKAVHLFIHSDLLTYKNNSTGLTESYKIVDTPGINDPVESRDRIAKAFLREAHAAIMLTRADRYKTDTDISFINSHIINGGMSKILFTINKIDLLFASSEKPIPDNLLDAMEDYVGYVDGKYEEKGELNTGFHQDVKPRLTNGEATMYTVICSLAEQIRFKLEKVGGSIHLAKLLENEASLLSELQEWFPEDFCEDSPELRNNLKLIGGIERLKETFLLNEFLENKDHIVAQRYADQNKLLCEDILKQFNVEVKEIKDNQNLLNSVDLKGFENQVKILEKLKNNGLKELFECVDKVVIGLEAFVTKTLFSDRLVPYKLSLKEDATEYERVSYTRKGTSKVWLFGGNVKNEKVEVNRVQPESVVSSHGKGIDNLHAQLKRLWKENFLKERDALVHALLECIKTIANKDATLGIEASVYTKALENVVDTVLIGREILDLESWIDRQRIELDKYARKSDHTSLDTNYSEKSMSAIDAKEIIKKQAEEKVNVFKTGMGSRYIDFYDNLKNEVLKEIGDLNRSLQSFVQNVTTQLEAVLNNFINEKNEMIKDRLKSEKEKKELVDYLNSFKKKFERL